MELFLTILGALYSAECADCGGPMHTHEWAHSDHNERRDAMQAGTLRCDDCGGAVDAATFADCGRQYAGRYDCTDWQYGRNKRELARDLRATYGSN